MTSATILIDVLAALTLGAALLGYGVNRRNRWPEQTPRPYGCSACRVEYSDARALAWHVGAMHIDTYQSSHWQPAAPMLRDETATTSRRDGGGVEERA